MHKTTRRGFFGTLLGAYAARFLPAPTKTLPFEPKFYEVSVPISLDAINRTTLEHLVPKLRDDYFKADPILAYFNREMTSTGAQLQVPLFYDAVKE